MDYKQFLAQQEKENVFLAHRAGDTNGFRYPHLAHFADAFSYDADRKLWRYSARQEEPAFRFAAEDITAYELLVPKAWQLHLLDLIALPYPDRERQAAFDGVKDLYDNRRSRFPKIKMRTVRLNEVPVRAEFAYVAQLYRELENEPVQFMVVENAPCACSAPETAAVNVPAGSLPIEKNSLNIAHPFPFGSMLKGTNLVFSDDTPGNFGPDLLHALYHIKEGIPGVNGDNAYVEELWAPVSALYALQLERGRMARRKRLRPTPHPIRFTDYIFLRAYLGQAFEPAATDRQEAGRKPEHKAEEHKAEEHKAGRMHPAYAVIEPSLRLMLYPLRHHSAYDRNRILADAVLEDQTRELIAAFDGEFYKGSFEAVFGTWALYEKYTLAQGQAAGTRPIPSADRNEMKELLPRTKLEEILFEGPHLLPSCVPREIVRKLWTMEELRRDYGTVLAMLEEAASS